MVLSREKKMGMRARPVLSVELEKSTPCLDPKTCRKTELPSSIDWFSWENLWLKPCFLTSNMYVCVYIYIMYIYI